MGTENIDIATDVCSIPMQSYILNSVKSAQQRAQFVRETMNANPQSNQIRKSELIRSSQQQTAALINNQLDLENQFHNSRSDSLVQQTRQNLSKLSLKLSSSLDSEDSVKRVNGILDEVESVLRTLVAELEQSNTFTSLIQYNARFRREELELANLVDQDHHLKDEVRQLETMLENEKRRVDDEYSTKSRTQNDMEASVADLNRKLELQLAYLSKKSVSILDVHAHYNKQQ